MNRRKKTKKELRVHEKKRVYEIQTRVTVVTVVRNQKIPLS